MNLVNACRFASTLILGTSGSQRVFPSALMVCNFRFVRPDEGSVSVTYDLEAVLDGRCGPGLSSHRIHERIHVPACASSAVRNAGKGADHDRRPFFKEAAVLLEGAEAVLHRQLVLRP